MLFYGVQKQRFYSNEAMDKWMMSYSQSNDCFYAY